MVKINAKAWILFIFCVGFAIKSFAQQRATITLDISKEKGKVNRLIFGNNQLGYQYEAWKTRQEYARRYLEYRKAMKSIDSRIKLGAVVVPGVRQSLLEWDKEVLKTIGTNIDFVIPHTYIPGYNRNDGIPDSNTLFSIGLAGPNQVPIYLRQLNEQIRQSTGRNDIPLANTEFNGHFVQEKPVPYRLCLGNALIVADMLKVFMQPESNVVIANYWQFANEYWGMVKGYQPPYTLRPAYWVFWLYAQHFGDILIDAQVKCGSYDTDGGYGVMSAMGKPAQFELFSEDILPQQEWKFSPVEGKLEQSEENEVLIAEIKTDENFNYYHGYKEMPVEPLTGYRLTAEIKTEGLEKGRGASIQMGDRRGYDKTKSVALSKEVKSPQWEEISADYIALSDAEGIVIQARRLESKDGIGSKGKIFIRNVKVQKFIPFNAGSVPYLSVNASKSTDGKKVFIAIVNKHLSKPIETSIEGVKTKESKAWCLTGPGVDATNEKDPNNVCVTELPILTTTDTIKISLPQHSMTVVEIEKK